MKKLTPEDIEALIIKETYTVYDDKLTVCVLTCKNTFKVSGEASCVRLEDFDVEIGRKVSRAKAFAKVWELEAYVMQSKLAGLIVDA
jgi:hypothetical protein